MTSYSHNPFREKKDFIRIISPTENPPLAVCNYSALQVIRTKQKQMNLLLSLFSQRVETLKRYKIAAI